MVFFESNGMYNGPYHENATPHYFMPRKPSWRRPEVNMNRDIHLVCLNLSIMSNFDFSLKLLPFKQWSYLI